jgi:2-methylcitrate dehydratase PrpD
MPRSPGSRREWNDPMRDAALTTSLGEFVSRLRFADVPGAAWTTVRDGMADCVATMIAGRNEPAVRILKTVLGAGAAGEATLYFSTERASALDAAWINGTAAHALDYDDVALRGHPSTAIVPALLAEGEALDSPGESLALAYVAGYEVWADLVDRERGKHHDKGWHPTGIFGPLAAAAACARLRGLDAPQSAHALGIAASRASGIMANFGSMTKPFHAGCAAHAGIAAARLAALGMTSSADALEHPQGFLNAVSPAGDYDARPRAPDAPWQIVRQGLSIKKYPICFAAHRVVDATLDLAREHRIDPAGVGRATVSLSVLASKLLRNALPQNALEAKFSIQFAVAAALLAGNVGLRELRDEYVASEPVQRLMKRVGIVTNENYDTETPVQSVYDEVEIELVSGVRWRSAQVRRPRGHPSNPLRAGELWTKFSDCLAAGGEAIEPAPLFDALQHIDRLRSVKALYG